MDKTKKQQDLEDYNHATSGLNVGRNHGFATPDHATAERVDADNADAHFDIAFAMLMEAEEQRRIEFEQQLRDLNDRYAELDRASWAALIEAEENLKDIQSRANRSIDGRRIYMSEEDGQVYYEDGSVVAPDNIDPDTWDKNGPKYAEVQDWLGKYEAARIYRAEVVEVGEEFKGEITKDKFDALQGRIESLRDDMPPTVRQHYQPEDSAANHRTPQKGSLSSTVFFDIRSSLIRGFDDGEDWLRVA